MPHRLPSSRRLNILLGKALAHDQKAWDALVRIFNDEFISFFCHKICNRSHTTSPDIMKYTQKLCENTFKMAKKEIDKGFKNTISCTAFMLNAAESLWFELSDRLNHEKDIVLMGELFLLSQNVLVGYFIARFRGRRDIDELIHDTLLLAKDNIRKHPYDPHYSIYTYFKNNARIVALRNIQAPISYTHPERPEKPQTDPGRQKPVGPKETIEIVIEQFEDKRRLLHLKLTCLQFCALSVKPHQFLAFGLKHWIGMKPSEIVLNYSFMNFKQLANELLALTEHKADYFNTMNVVVELTGHKPYQELEIKAYFQPLFDKLEQKTYTVYKPSGTLGYGAYSDLISKYGYEKIMNLTFENFYSSAGTITSKAKHISDWSYRMKATVMSALKVCWVDVRNGWY